jgi:ComF family protein
MITALLDIIYPKTCICCNSKMLDSELFICTSCSLEIPATSCHNSKSREIKNALYGRVNLEAATSLFSYNSNLVKQVVHNLKYKNQPYIGSFLGRWLGMELAQNSNFKDIDVVTSVPMHFLKKIKRGYNQVDHFSKEIANCLGVVYVPKVLRKKINTKSQVSKSRKDRAEFLEHKFALRKFNNLEGKHILLLDDIITTGATIEACAIQLKKIKGVKISVASIAFVD